MSEVTHIHPEDFLQMLKRSERLGAFKALNWLCNEFTDEMIAKDLVELVQTGIGSISEKLYDDFKRENFIYGDIFEIIKKRKKEEDDKAAVQ